MAAAAALRSASGFEVSRRTRPPQSRRVSGLLGSALSSASYCAAASANFWSWASWPIRASRRSRRVGASLIAFSYQPPASATRPCAARRPAQPDQRLDVVGVLPRSSARSRRPGRPGRRCGGRPPRSCGGPRGRASYRAGACRAALRSRAGPGSVRPSRTFSSAAVMASWTWRNGSRTVFARRLVTRAGPARPGPPRPAPRRSAPGPAGRRGRASRAGPRRPAPGRASGRAGRPGPAPGRSRAGRSAGACAARARSKASAASSGWPTSTRAWPR